MRKQKLYASYLLQLHLEYAEPLPRVVWVIVQKVQLLDYMLTGLRQIWVPVIGFDVSTHVVVLETLCFNCDTLLIK
jgi:hypothetical protein